MLHTPPFLAPVRSAYQQVDRDIGRLARLRERAGRQVDGSSLAAARVAFGAIGVLSMVRILANGWVSSLYAGAPGRFTYPGLAWVPKPSEAVLHAVVVIVGVAAAAVTVGWHVRAALATFWLGFAWIELIDMTTYLNHYWFVTLFGLLLLAAPVTEELAVGATHRTVAVGWVWLLRSQVAVVYSFAGLAKLNGDWLLHAMPLRMWLPARADLPVIGPLLTQPWAAFALSWAGAAFDCSVVALLLWRRSRRFAWLAVVVFHVMTWWLFAIGVFPWLMIAVTTLFFDPAWPKALAARVRPQRAAPAPQVARPLPRRFVGVAVVWVAVQVLVPLRASVIPGDASWTGEGYRWSWNVLLVEKGGSVSFRVTDVATGRTSVESAEDLYSPLQWKAMSSDPEMIRQAAHAVAARHRAAGERVEVRVDAFVSLNGRRAVRIIDPGVDLAAEPWRIHQPWILAAPSGPPP